VQAVGLSACSAATLRFKSEMPPRAARSSPITSCWPIESESTSTSVATALRIPAGQDGRRSSCGHKPSRQRGNQLTLVSSSLTRRQRKWARARGVFDRQHPIFGDPPSVHAHRGVCSWEIIWRGRAVAAARCHGAFRYCERTDDFRKARGEAILTVLSPTLQDAVFDLRLTRRPGDPPPT
jgi:hypothetical protein